MPSVRLRLDLAGVGLEFSGSEAFYHRWVEPIVAATCQREQAPEPPPIPDDAPLATSNGEAAAPVDEAPMSAVFQPESPARFQQFVAQVGPRAATNEQQVMAFGFYLWNYEKRNTFDRADVEGFFGLLHQECPDAFEAMIDGLVEKKRFLEPEAAGHWRLTSKGVNYVKNRLLGTV